MLKGKIGEKEEAQSLIEYVKTGDERRFGQCLQ
jgi:hypothetical protein